ncbi:MAG: hypothetical protein JO073_11270 [Actinobacteria bacterium]|nr:hypothetical protein [Actinomycetota bacterium]
MTTEEPRGQAPAGRDPEAEQEVDFARYAKLLAVRWWLLAGGLVLAALVGYAISSGGSNVYSASATVYLGQPYSASGNIQLQTLQTNPSALNAIVHSEQVAETVANACKAKASQFRGGISTQAVAGALTKNGQNPVVKISVQARKSKVAACAANGIADAVVSKLGVFAQRKINNFRAQIEFDTKSIQGIQSAIGGNSLSTTDKLVLQTQLRADQQDKIAATQLLLQATQVEAPHLLTGAASQKVTARSRRNTVVVSALIGLVLGALLALLWDKIVPRLTFRNGE